MKKNFVILSCLLVTIACNNNKTKGTKVDTTPALSQTNNSVEILVDTLGYSSDSATQKYETGSNLIAQSDCLSCHKPKEANIGPSYVCLLYTSPSPRDS